VNKKKYYNKILKSGSMRRIYKNYDEGLERKMYKKRVRLKSR
jgi:hypothetical protein